MRDFVAHVRRHLPPRDLPADAYDRMVDELASELEARYVALTERGVSDEDAWTAVVAEVPSWPGLARTLATSSRGSTAGASLPQLWLAIDRTWRDLRHGVRVLRKQRGFTLTAIVTLAICLGGHAAILAGLNAMVRHPWRIPEPDRVLIVANQYPRVEERRSSVSAPPDYLDRLHGVPAFDEQALYNQFIATIDTGDGATRIRGMVATPSLFRLLRVNPVLGRIFAEESAAGHDARILLSDGLWRDLFGADPTAIGRTLRLTGRDFTIVGIMPRGFVFGGSDVRFWVPLVLTEQQRSDEARHRNGWFNVGRLKPGATIEQVRDQLRAIDAANFERTPPRVQTLLRTTGFYTSAERLQDVLVRDIRGPIYLLWSAALAVLAIGVMNLSNLALARARSRVDELGTRLAMGARRFDLVRQLMIEGTLIGVSGSLAGLVAGWWLLSVLRTQGLTASDLEIDAVVVGVTLGLGLVAGIIVGLASASPAFVMRLDTMLRDGSRRGTAGRATRLTRQALILAQVACSFVLLLGSALLWVSLRNLLAVDLGFNTEQVITGFATLSGPRYAADTAARGFVDRSLEAIRQIPGVAAAGATTIVPLAGYRQTGVLLAEDYVPAAGELPVAGVRSLVTPGYFEAVGTPLVAGRYFDGRDRQPGSKSVVIDERLARRFWPAGDAVGRRVHAPTNPGQITIDANTPWRTVVGVVRAARLAGPQEYLRSDGTTGTVYFADFGPTPRDVGYVIRTIVEPTAVLRDLRTALATVDRDVALFDVRTVSERRELAMLSRTNTLRLAALFAVVAVFLAAVGLHGVLAYLVAQRTREIGVRMALGSTPRAIVQMVFREGLGLALGGTALGAIAVVALGRSIASQLYAVTPVNPWLMLLAALTLVGVAGVACAIPARRAARIDVVRALGAP